MDLSGYDSLRPCAETEVIYQLQDAKEKVTIYAAEIDPQQFVKLNLPAFPKIHLIVSDLVLKAPNATFMSLFNDVFYESLHAKVDLQKEKRVKLYKEILGPFIGILTMLFLCFSHIFWLKMILFTLIIFSCGFFYYLLKRKMQIIVSNIKHRTHFKVMATDFLKTLPSLYIIDGRLYIGGNLFTQEAGDYYEVKSTSDCHVLIKLYDDYVTNHRQISEQEVIAHYIERLHSKDLAHLLYE